jgi:hypothetical protein
MISEIQLCSFVISYFAAKELFSVWWINPLTPNDL